ncbi:MAG: hypothetical protein H6609_09835 [Ignavibacteriales bacterium]|nr:hypothetical protein [Ignavibacteriales bacterium]
MIKFLVRYKTEFTIFSLVLLVNLFLTSLPLINILSYESSAINGILFSLISGIYRLKIDKKVSLKTHFKFFIILSIIPFIILSISTILCQKCPLDDGIYFYIIIAIPSIIVGISLAQFSNFISQSLKYFVFVIVWIFVLLGFLPELYYNPQIYFYNPIFGYYPGVIYDQNIEITRDLIFYRISNIIFSIIVLTVLNSKFNFKKYSKLIVISALMLIYLNIGELKTKFNFSTDLARIQKELPQTIVTEHFNIIVPDSLEIREIELLKYDHEFYYLQISKLLKTEVNGKIQSIIFESGAQKKRLFGSANADVAKPWLNQIYLNYDNYKSSLKHEIAHIFSANFSSGLFKVPYNFNPGMIEGFAMAVENNYDNYEIHYLAKLGYINNYKVSLSSLFTDYSFFANASSISYIFAGSFFKYLADNYSWEKVKKVYNSNDFEKIFNTKLVELENEYYTFLENYKIENNENSANYYFGRLPLIKKFCARATAKQLIQANEFYSNEEFQKSAELFSNIYKYSGTYSALVGFAQSNRSLGQLQIAIDTLENEIDKFNGSGYFYFLEFLLADFYSLNNDSSKADEYYSKIIDQNPHLRYLISANVKQKLLHEGDSVLIKYMSDFDFKDQKLIEIVKNNPNNENITLLVTKNFDSLEQYQNIIELINSIVINCKLNSETYFAISGLAYEFMDIENSIIFAKLALNQAKINTNIYEEHHSKLMWIKKYQTINTN